MMYILDHYNTMNEIGIYRVCLILKYAVNIVTTIVPLIVIILSMIDIGKAVINPNDLTKDIKTSINRIISGLIVFLIPSVISYAFTLIENYDDSFITKYYNGASAEKIKALEEQYKQEVKEYNALNKAKSKEKIKERLEEERKRNEQIEEFREAWEQEQQQQAAQQGGSGGNYAGDSVSSGTYGSVRFENGTFYIPNSRATSDADIPKQSGQYGLNPIFWERLSALINDAAANGYTISVTSGWRSYSSQRSLWDNSSRPCSERSKWVACPGGSRHGFGIAADLSFNGTSCSGGWDCNSAAAWVHNNAANYGLTFRMSWEPWHIEPTNIQGGSFGACTATC